MILAILEAPTVTGCSRFRLLIPRIIAGHPSSCIAEEVITLRGTGSPVRGVQHPQGPDTYLKTPM